MNAGFKARGGSRTGLAIDELRKRLLDLSLNNQLLNFSLSEKSKRQIRLIDEVPSVLIEKLRDGKQMIFAPVEMPDIEPEDEKTAEFQAALKGARQTDAEWANAKAKLGPRPRRKEVNALERDLRDRLRAKLGMAPWRSTRSAKEQAELQGINTSYDLGEKPDHGRRGHTDDRLQTLFFPEDMEAKLSAIHSAAASLEKDAGVHALYVAFGFLEWYQARDSSDKLYAPLLLWPIGMSKQLVNQRYEYAIAGRDEDEAVNQSLIEKMRADFSLVVPDIRKFEDEDEEGLDLNGWLKAVDKAAKSVDPRWRVCNWATVGLMTFHKIAIWEDLDPAKWPKSADPRENPLLDQIFGDGEPWDGMPAQDYDIDAEETEGNGPLLITDADSSQHSAVIDVMKGKDLVIQGPPGTGKSQTITNIISAALNDGKSVLFVSEKMAALEVVKSRLDAAGLSEFCLELHSDKASRASVLASLKTRMEMRVPQHRSAEIESLRATLEKRKSDLTSYVEKMNAPAGDTGKTVHDIIWGHARTKELLSKGPKRLRDVRIADALMVGPFDLSELKRIAQSLDDAAFALGEEARPSLQPWRGIDRTDFTTFHADEICDRALTAAASARRAEVAIKEATRLAGWTIVPTDANALALYLNGFFETEPNLPTGDIAPSLLGLMDGAARDAANKLWRLLQDRREGLAALETLGDAEKLLTAGSELAREEAIVARLGIGDLTPVGLQDEARKLDILVGKTDAAIEALRKLGGVLGTDAHLIPAGAGALIAAIRVGFPSSEARAVRSAALAREGAAAALEKTKLYADAIRSAAGKLGDGAALDAIPGAAELSAALETMHSTGFLGKLFSGEFKSARALAKRIRPGAKLKHDGLIAALEGAVSWRKCMSEFEAHVSSSPIVSAIVGVPSAPFGALIECARWMEKVRRVTPATVDGAPLIRKTVIEADEDSINILDSFLEAHGAIIEALAREGASGIDEAGRKLHERRASIGQVLGILRQVSWSELPIGRLSEAARHAKAVAKAREGIAAAAVPKFALGALWRGEDTDSDLILKAVEAAEAMERWPLTRIARRRICESPDLVAACGETVAALRAASEEAKAALVQMAAFSEHMQLSMPSWCDAADLRKAFFGVFAERCERAAERPDLLPRQCTLVSLENIARASGLGGIIDAWIEEDLAFLGLASVIEAVWLRSTAEAIVRSDPTLSSHAGHAHEGIRRSFQKLDVEWLSLNRQELRAKLARRQPPPGSRSGPRRDWRDRELLAHQCSLDRPSMHLRKLFAQAGEAIRAYKPCIMMSPMSVARYLQPSREKFDIVVIDEASQMRPEDAAGALLRGKQAVIVGDPKQLPPSNFFQAQGSADDFDEDANEVVEDSILELAMRAWKPVRTLKWHYRSRHQSLIAYSNARFYDSRLIVFPSDRERGPTAGVHLENVKGVYSGGRNEIEARSIVDAAAKFMAAHPTKSLGIVAMNQKQQQLISDLMDQLYVDDPTAESYRRHWSGELEHVFVKNLENVQGDERDAIFISTVYGPDEKGAFVMRFGPINLLNGHRRLNVLFTRAKEMMTVFTSMDPGAIRVGAGSHEGPKVLKEYLDYARTGHVPTSPDEDEERQPESEFERWFIDRLRHRGYEAVPQVGVRGYRIDIGIRHPEMPGRFILGVECDGATYHSAKAVRDRDRLRQMVLERLGWQIHRIWSTDWFRDSQAEFDALLRKIDELRRTGRSIPRPEGPPASTLAG